MNRPIILHAAVLCLFLAGCLASPESYLTAHPETPPNIAATMRQRDVVAGMTRDQVRIVWGTPDSKAGWSGGDSWTYTRSRSANVGSDMPASNWGMPINNATSAQQNQLPFSPPTMTGGKPRGMVYFRGDQVVLVERANGGL